MRRFSLGALGAVAFTLATAPAALADDGGDVRALVKDEIKAYLEQKKADDTKEQVFKAKWKDGLAFETPDKRFTLKIGGRVHLDTVFTSAEEALQGPNPGLADDFDAATYFRRLRLYVAGDLTPYVDYKIQLDFADPSDGQVKDAWITVKKLKECLGCWAPSIRFGHQFDCLGLEHQTSSNHTAFIEKSLTDALHPGRALGVQLFDSFWKERAVAQVGVFSTDKDDDVNGFALWDEDDTDGGWAATGRFSLIPWAQNTCRFLHVGVGGSYRNAHEVRFSARPGLGRGPAMVDTGAISSDLEEQTLVNGELALVWDSLHVSAEFAMHGLTSPSRGDPSFSAWYVQAGWFLTGESKAYAFPSGLWGNTKPCCSFLSNGCCCWGAFELVARLDMLDLNDGTVTGGELTNVAAGLNWYLNPNVRLMLNVIFSNTQDRASGGVVIADEDVTSFLMRWDVHF